MPFYAVYALARLHLLGSGKPNKEQSVGRILYAATHWQEERAVTTNIMSANSLKSHQLPSAVVVQL
jgi:hypothetical protein